MLCTSYSVPVSYRIPPNGATQMKKQTQCRCSECNEVADTPVVINSNGQFFCSYECIEHAQEREQEYLDSYDFDEED